jgi:hypothetical protein
MSYDKDDRLIVEDLEKLLDYLEQEKVGEEFALWLADESEEAYDLDFVAWLQKRKEKENEGNNLPSGTDIS